MKYYRCWGVVLMGALLAGSAGAAEAAKAPAVATSDAVKASGLTSAQWMSGAKAGLAAMIDLAAGDMNKPGAATVEPPASMARLLGIAQKVNQSGAIDGFKSSLSAAAGSVMPQVPAVLKETLAGLKLEDATALANGAPGSATSLMRKLAEPALKTKLMPLVTQAIAANGLAAKAKELAAKAGPMAALAGVPTGADLETYLYTKVLETSFGYLAKGEAALRANPGQLKDKDAAKVFSLGKK